MGVINLSYVRFIGGRVRWPVYCAPKYWNSRISMTYTMCIYANIMGQDEITHHRACCRKWMTALYSTLLSAANAHKLQIRIKFITFASFILIYIKDWSDKSSNINHCALRFSLNMYIIGRRFLLLQYRPSAGGL